MTLTDKWTKENVILSNLQLSALLLDIDMKNTAKTFLGQGQDRAINRCQRTRSCVCLACTDAGQYAAGTSDIVNVLQDLKALRYTAAERREQQDPL